ncbi:response regulator [Salidesulfovibrio onnuriiensis]|uniref:response regulator n=1 Tax=Salidesulfovibrio onnuriiensis TaxID=2583823 RepID=UPI0011CBD5D4|nr:response regulator [Salidesulfovibrio onnuriiensis]
MAAEIDLNMRILVVDDSATMRRIVVSALRECGFKNIVTADDGKTAWPHIEAGSIELVLSDQKMPGMDGLELLQMVRENEKFKELPFIMITAEAYKENVMEAVKLGVSNYIVKPFNTNQLIAKIVKVLGASLPAES